VVAAGFGVVGYCVLFQWSLDPPPLVVVAPSSPPSGGVAAFRSSIGRLGHSLGRGTMLHSRRQFLKGHCHSVGEGASVPLAGDIGTIGTTMLAASLVEGAVCVVDQR
jgi:hypothetical protein